MDLGSFSTSRELQRMFRIDLGSIIVLLYQASRDVNASSCYFTKHLETSICLISGGAEIFHAHFWPPEPSAFQGLPITPFSFFVFFFCSHLFLRMIIICLRILKTTLFRIHVNEHSHIPNCMRCLWGGGGDAICQVTNNSQGNAS